MTCEDRSYRLVPISEILSVLDSDLLHDEGSVYDIFESVLREGKWGSSDSHHRFFCRNSCEASWSSANQELHN